MFLTVPDPFDVKGPTVSRALWCQGYYKLKGQLPNVTNRLQVDVKLHVSKCNDTEGDVGDNGDEFFCYQTMCSCSPMCLLSFINNELVLQFCVTVSFINHVYGVALCMEGCL